MFNKNLLTGISVAVLAHASVASACTGISLATTVGDHIHARTIEWGNFNLNSKLIVSARGHSYTSQLPEKKTGLTWENKHGFVGISVSDDRFIGEGMNEVGLNAGLFYFPGYGSLAPYDPDDTGNNVADMDLVRWMLSQFSTVDEVKANVDKIKVVPIFIDAAGQPSPTAHWRVADKSGGSMVIEIMDKGKVHIYDNKVGVLTNSPDFPWMMTNLNTYINIQPGTVAPREVGGQKLRSFGVGTASFGLPGDISPPSRFVRAAFYRNTAPPLETPLEAVSQAFHILANFDLPIGIEFGEDERNNIPNLPSATQWTAASDLSSGRFYYKTMYDSSIKQVDLNEIAFDGGAEMAHALDKGTFTYKDVTP
jgi:choloylglycine hydrolase